MVLDVESPEPPDLTNRGLPSDLEFTDALESASDLRRPELEESLREGAWREAFHEWAEYTELTEAEYRTIRDHDLFEQLDFYWDPAAERLRFDVPTTPASWPESDDFEAKAVAELTDLGQTVLEMLTETYVDWSEEESPDAVWTEEMYTDETPPDD
jgi:hypothetical protein